MNEDSTLIRVLRELNENLGRIADALEAKAPKVSIVNVDAPMTRAEIEKLREDLRHRRGDVA